MLAVIPTLFALFWTVVLFKTPVPPPAEDDMEGGSDGGSDEEQGDGDEEDYSEED